MAYAEKENSKDDSVGSNVWENAKDGMLPGIISSVFFFILFFTHFFWQFYLFENLPWMFPAIFIVVIGISVLIGTIIGALLGVIYRLFEKLLPWNNIALSLFFTVLLTGILTPFILWRLIWAEFIIGSILLSLFIWCLIRNHIAGKSMSPGKKRVHRLILGLCLLLLFSLGFLGVIFMETGADPADILGDTSLNGITGNSGLTAGLTANGRLALLSWPSPSYHDQLEYTTASIEEEYYGAEPEMGAFGGIHYKTVDEEGVRWLWENTWEHEQTYKKSSSNVLETKMVDEELGLKIITYNFVLPEKDVLVRNYEIQKSEDSPLNDLKFLAYGNFHPSTEKMPWLPLTNYFQRAPVSHKFPFLKEERAGFFVENSLFFSERKPQGNDFNKEAVEKGEIFLDDFSASDVFIGMSSDREITGYQVGEVYGSAPDCAYEESTDGRLSNSNYASGAVNGAFLVNFDDNDWNNNGQAEVTVYIAAAENIKQTEELLDEAKDNSFEHHLKKTEDWWDKWLQDAKLPDTENELILDISKRSLVTIKNAYDKETGAIVASVSRQPPYFLDWPRDGAFINYALNRAGYHGMVEKHNEFYADIQRAGGSWGMNYYADGMEGGPILFEIDNTALAVWTMWQHYEFTEDISYLEGIYPSIRKAAELLHFWKDPTSNLHFYAHEDDNPLLTQTLDGAVPIYLGLRSAVKAGKAVGEEEDTINKWKDRADLLKKDIEEKLWNPEEGKIKSQGQGDTWMIWPAEFRSFEDSRMQATADINWETVKENMEADTAGESGQYEVSDILALAKMWSGDEEKMEKLENSMEWVAEEIAGESTLHFGEAHQLIEEQGELRWKNRVGIPHVWTHALFYLCALEVYGEEDEAQIDEF